MLKGAFLWAIGGMTFAAVAENDAWTPGIGDPTLAGWLTTIAYFVAFGAAVACARRMLALYGIRSREFVFWTGLAVLLFLLGVNKQLDVQTLFTQTGRQMSKTEGWYNERRSVQESFILGITLGGFATSALLGWFVHPLSRSFKTATFGVVFLVCFVIIRATSFHHIDALLGMRFEGMKLNWILENGGILTILASAIWALKTATLEMRYVAQEVIELAPEPEATPPPPPVAMPIRLEPAPLSQREQVLKRRQLLRGDKDSPKP